MSIQIDANPREESLNPTPVEELMEVEIDGPGKVMMIGATLPTKHVDYLAKLLIKFRELFTWHLSDMTGIATSVITHKVNSNPMVKPVA